MNQSIFCLKSLDFLKLDVAVVVSYLLSFYGVRMFAPRKRPTTGNYLALVRVVVSTSEQDVKFVEVYSRYVTSLGKAQLLAGIYRLILRAMYPRIKEHIVAYTWESRKIMTSVPFWHPSLAQDAFTHKGKLLWRSVSACTGLAKVC